MQKVPGAVLAKLCWYIAELKPTPCNILVPTYKTDSLFQRFHLMLSICATAFTLKPLVLIWLWLDTLDSENKFCFSIVLMPNQLQDTWSLSIYGAILTLTNTSVGLLCQLSGLQTCHKAHLCQLRRSRMWASLPLPELFLVLAEQNRFVPESRKSFQVGWGVLG